MNINTVKDLQNSYLVNNSMIINTVKDLQNSYLVNNSISVPKDSSNSDYQAVQKWIAEGNKPDPEFTPAELLQNAKNDKIKELEVFHESDEVRILTINNTFKVSTNYEKTRKWFNEIIYDLENESDVTGKPHDDIVFEWEIATGVWLPLKLSQLKQFKYAVFNITRVNFKQYRTHIKAIESLTTKTKIKNYDFKKGYLLNNKLNFNI